MKGRQKSIKYVTSLIEIIREVFLAFCPFIDRNQIKLRSRNFRCQIIFDKKRKY